jgi:hypothetical protein
VPEVRHEDVDEKDGDGNAYTRQSQDHMVGSGGGKPGYVTRVRWRPRRRLGGGVPGAECEDKSETEGRGQ